MKLTVAGQDRSSDLGRGVSAQAQARAEEGSPKLLPPEHSALRLRDARSEADFLSEYLRLLRLRHGVDMAAIAPPRRPGLLGALAYAVKAAAWKLVAGRIQRIVDRQNVVNELLALGLEFAHDELKKRGGRP